MPLTICTRDDRVTDLFRELMVNANVFSSILFLNMYMDDCSVYTRFAASPAL